MVNLFILLRKFTIQKSSFLSKNDFLMHIETINIVNNIKSIHILEIIKERGLGLCLYLIVITEVNNRSMRYYLC